MVFIDTNILVYAYDIQAGKKHVKAIQLIEAIWTEKQIPSISTQVLNELACNLLRKMQPISLVKQIIADCSLWNVILHQEQDTLLALELKERWQLSFWDSMILVAAKKSGAVVLWSEDFSHNQMYDELKVVNPFR